MTKSRQNIALRLECGIGYDVKQARFAWRDVFQEFGKIWKIPERFHEFNVFISDLFAGSTNRFAANMPKPVRSHHL